MNELCSTKEIIEKIKDIISRQPSFRGKKVFDIDVAGVLRLTQANLATKKRRNVIPFKEIVLFCERCGLDSRDILFKKKSC